MSKDNLHLLVAGVVTVVGIVLAILDVVPEAIGVILAAIVGVAIL